MYALLLILLLSRLYDFVVGHALHVVVLATGVDVVDVAVWL